MTAQPSYLAASLSVAAGGATGAWLRFMAGRLIGANLFPYATLTVNVQGCVLSCWYCVKASGVMPASSADVNRGAMPRACWA